jgi:hypothetical protein
MMVRQQIIPLVGVAVLVGVGAAVVGVAVGPVEPPASPGIVAVAVGPVEAPVEVPDCEEMAQAPMTTTTASNPMRTESRRAYRKKCA